MELDEFTDNAEQLRNKLLLQARHYFRNAGDAEDAVQETLIRLWMARKRICDAGKMRNMASVVCRNVSLNMLREVQGTTPIEEARTIAVHDSPQTQMEAAEGWRQLNRSIRALSDKYRAILRMRNVEGIPYADIARIMGTSESSVRGMVSKARKELIRNMKGFGL